MRETWKSVILMVMVQISYSGINVLYKLAVKDGMSLRVIIAYRFIFAAAFMAPLAFFFESVERLNWREGAGKAKTLGTLTGIGGAMLLTFFKGPPIHTPSFHLEGHVAASHSSSTTGGSTLLGAICAMSGSLSYALWLIVQAKMSEKFACHYSTTALMNVTASVFSVGIAFCFERDWSQWRLGWNIRLLTVAYAGLVPAGVAVVVIAWCVHVRGPLFVSAFSPLTLVILAFVASFFLDEILCLGRVGVGEGEMGKIWKVVDGLKPVMLLVMVQSSYAALNVLYKLALSDGINLRVLIAYRFIFATAFMAPLALLFERKKMPKITWTILFQSLLCGLFGVERLNWREAGGKAKSIGTLIGIGGAMLLTFFKGPQIHTPSFHVTFLQPHPSHVASPHSSSAGSTLLGAMCAVGASLSFALWLIVQTKMSQRFPCHYSSTALMNAMASLFSVAFAFCFQRDLSQWRLGISACWSGGGSHSMISYSVLNVFNKLAYNDFGLNIRVALTYRFIFATAFMAPLALFFESMENLNWRAAAGKAKILGIVTAMGGTMLLTLFKGPQLDTPSFHVSFLHPHVASPHSATSASSGNSNIALGALCVVGGGLSFALWFIVQAKVSEKYPCHYSSTALMNVMASVLSVAFAFCVDRDWSEWRLGWNIKLLTVAYSGLVPGGIMVVVIAWCVHMRGPLFVSIFSPMVLLISAFVQSFLMGEKLNLGTIIGGVLIVCGLYMVLWGKGKEIKNNKMTVSNSMPSEIQNQHVPPPSTTVEINVVKSPLNHNFNTSNDVRNCICQDSSSQNGSQVVHHIHSHAIKDQENNNKV
ncbi:WAT1-related protein [Senna tora]|uniref:WAT1-related protein n=1 Tax=Senna tora TaxID=362788 RepID=A0A834VZ92_9FABA|nr:WAT1-related protein [Senna tora]